MITASPTCSIRYFRPIKTPAMCWRGSRKTRSKRALRLDDLTVMPGQKREARLRARVPGHPRLFFVANTKDVDGRNKSGHDEVRDHAKSARTLANTLRNISGVSTRVLVL